jgi:hypothetical protein
VCDARQSVIPCHGEQFCLRPGGCSFDPPRGETAAFCARMDRCSPNPRCGSKTEGHHVYALVSCQLFVSLCVCCCYSTQSTCKPNTFIMSVYSKCLALLSVFILMHHQQPDARSVSHQTQMQWHGTVPHALDHFHSAAAHIAAAVTPNMPSSNITSPYIYTSVIWCTKGHGIDRAARTHPVIKL